MPYTLCVYYSRTGNTEKIMGEIAAALRCELVRPLPPVKPIKTAFPLGVYDLVIIGTPVWAGRCSAPVRSFLSQYGGELRRVAYVITRSSEVRYEDVFDQMDLYVRTPRISGVTIRPNSVGADFWREEFLASVRDGGEERSGDDE